MSTVSMAWIWSVFKAAICAEEKAAKSAVVNALIWAVVKLWI